MVTAATAREVRRHIDECLVLLDCANAMCGLFGIPRADIPNQVELFEKLQEWRKQVVAVESAPRRAVLTNAGEMLRALRGMHQIATSNRQLWKSGPIKVLCDDDELRRLVILARDEGCAQLSKAEFDERFDVSAVDRFWRCVPDYTLVFLGHGLGISSPEFDLYYAMCHFHDRAVQGDRRLAAARDRVGVPTSSSDESEEVSFGSDVALHHTEVRQTVVSACLFVEAFVNSVAHAYRCHPREPLAPEVDRYLREQTVDPRTGGERDKFVSLKDKLTKWVAILSPRGQTLDAGSGPLQAFMEVQEYRDSIVHLTATKAGTYRKISLAVAVRATDVAVDVARSICRCISTDPAQVAYPRWLLGRKPTGLFEVATTIELAPDPA